VDSFKKSGLVGEHLFLCFLISFTFMLSGFNLFSREVQKPSRQSSLEAFSKGDYELAYRQFSELLVSYPGDPIYKYYSGICLVKLSRDPEKAVTLLKQAQQGSAAVRSIPSDSHFWLGRAQQMSGKFTEAVVSYNYYTEINGKKAAKDLGIPEFIQQCERREGRLAEKKTEEINKPGKELTETGKEVEKIITPAEKPETEIPVKDIVSSGYDEILSEAIELQYKADSLYRIAEEQKKGLAKGSYTERTKLKASITETENLAASFQDKADNKYNEAQASMNKKPFTEGNISVAAPAATATPEALPPDSLRKEIKAGTKKDTVIISADTARRVAVPKTAVNKPQPDTTAVKKTKDISTKGTIDLYSVFEVKDKASDEKIQINPSVPPGLIYRIQVAVFRNPLAYSYFKGIAPVHGFKTAGKDYTVYYAGMFRKLADANKALAVVRKKGFKDAFVAAVYGGKTVSSEKAAALEKDWSKKPITSVVVSKLPADTIPPTLTFRVEVTRSLKPVKEDVLEDIKKIAGTRGLEVITLEDKTMVYLIGTFITFESAGEYADLLKRNGYPDAKVGAWLGKKEIPVETARQLFERIE
jgi:tetratricopeptide (TPR) repeat protein